MKLTFKNNHFILENALDSSGFAPEGQWVRNHADNSFRTQNMQSAFQFEKVADSIARNIFNKKMIKHYSQFGVFNLPEVSAPEGLALMPFQKNFGIPFILSQSRTYLAHQPGLGKSAQAICAVGFDPGQTLIVCPSFLKINWAREITKWFKNDFPVVEIIPETAKQHETNWQADFIIVSDSMLQKAWVLGGLSFIRPKYVFIDEAHRFKDPEASRTTALFGGNNGKVQSPGLIYRAKHVCALSGTPMLNRPIELWPILFAMAPETIDFMSYQAFGFRYGGAWQDERGRWHFTGSENEDELQQRISGHFLQVLKKEDVLDELPDKIRNVIFIDREFRDKDLVEFDGHLRRRLKGKDILSEMNNLGDYAKLRHETGLAKVLWTASYVANILDQGDESLILFAHHRDVVEKLAQELAPLKPRIVNGGVKQDERTQIEDEFQSGKCRLIIGNIDAMNLGLTLTKATRVVFCEYAWTPALNEQAEDRAHRIGQRDSVYVEYVVFPNSLDEYILERLLEKQKIIERVIG